MDNHRRSTGTKIKWLLAFLMTGLILAACDSNPVPAKPAVPAATAKPGQAAQPAAVQPTAAPLGPAAVVNGQEIPMAVYARELELRKAGLAQRGINVNTPQGQAQFSQEKQLALDSMIDDLLIAQEAAKQGVTVTDAEVEASLQEIINQIGSKAAFEQLLQKSGQTLDDARTVQKTQLLNNKMRDKVVGALQTVEQVHARHILVDSAATAQALLTQIQGGADFAQIAQQSSRDTVTKANGGDLGWFARGTLVSKEVEDAAFALQPGQLSAVVQSAFGYHIIQMLERDPARKLEGDQLLKVQQQAMENWLNGLRAQAKVQRLAAQ
jgi:parvulin-like peptidyl-prolyl isomerase